MDATWKALADPVRRRIVEMVGDRPRTTGELCAAFDDLTRFGVIKHLGVLKDAGLIRVEKRGRERLNRLDPGPLRTLYQDWLRQVDVTWADRLDRLKRLAEQRQREQGMNETAWIGAPLASLHIRQTIDIAAPRATVFRALTEELSAWWGAPYLLSGADAVDLVLEPWPGGAFKEVTSDGGGYVWCLVEQVRRDRLLTLSGRMGMRHALAANVRFELEDHDSGTRLMLEHGAVGRLDATTEAEFSAGWADLLGERLKAFVERGERRGLKGDGDLPPQ